MYLSELRLYNFRRFLEPSESKPGLIVKFHKGLNIIVGENDSGKTAIIDAIRLLVGEVSDEFQRINDDDFYCDQEKNYKNNFKIEGRFCDLNKKEAGIFLDWLSFDNDGNYELNLTLVVERKINDNNHTYIDHKLMAGELNSMMPLRSEARSFLKATYLKPLRNANDELTPGFRSHLPQMLMAHSIFDKDSRRDNELVEIMHQANLKIENFFNSGELTKGEENNDSVNSKSVNEELSRILAQLYDSKEQSKSLVSLKLPEANILQILKQLSLSPDSNNLGLGNMNLLYIATELALLQDHLIHNIYGPNIMLVEELEAHLHVQAQIRLIKYIERYLNNHQPETSVQFILTSHSISLTASVDQRKLIYMNSGQAYSMSESYTMLDSADYGFLNRFLDATKANLFFAKGLIFVEGYAENILLPVLAELIGYSLHENGVSIVNIGSRAFDHYVKLFARRDKTEYIDLPIAIIRDSDIRPYTYRINSYNEDKIKELLTIKEINEENIGREFVSFKKLQKAFELKFPSENLESIKKETMQYFSEEELEEKQSDRVRDLQEKYKDLRVNEKVFVSPQWTLEYSLLLSSLYDLLLNSIAEVRYSFNTSKKSEYVQENHRENLVPFYQSFERNVSKAETAQVLAEKIHELDEEKKGKLRDALLEDEYCAYLLSAIKFACGQGSANK